MKRTKIGLPLRTPERGDPQTRIVGILCGIAVILLFSGFTLVSRLGLASSLKLMDIAALRFAIGGLLMLPVLLRYGLAAVRWRDALALAFTGGLGFALCAYAGFRLAPASHGAVLLHGTLPLFTFALAWQSASTTVTGRRACGVAAIFLGILAMAWDTLAASTTRQWLGDGCLLLASLSWSTYGLLARRQGLMPAHAASIVAVLSMTSFLPVYLMWPGKAILIAPWTELLLQGLFQGVLIGAVSIFVYSRAVASLGAVETALFTAAVPGVTTAAAYFLLQEVPSVIALIGVVAVTLGMVVSMTGSAPRVCPPARRPHSRRRGLSR
ncbi:DMT family transporter [Methylibium sp.]|uniref:DMT family transporter n=1 Tax=Methylibium sp. TaxID=2067992 RepID=UPI003D116F20